MAYLLSDTARYFSADIFAQHRATCLATTFCSVLAGGIAFVGFLSVQGVGNTFNGATASLAILAWKAFFAALLVLNLPVVVQIWRTWLGYKVSRAVWLNDGLVILYGFAVLVLLAFVSHIVSCIPLLFFLGGAFFTIGVLAFLRSSDDLRRDIIILILGAVFSIWLAAKAWGSRFLTPLFRENVMLGKMHVDTLYHMSIANMIKTYGIPSTGIDGPVYTPYHFGSHWLLATLSNLFRADVAAIYNVVYPIMFLPMFLYCLFLISRTAELIFCEKCSFATAQTKCFFWALILIAFIGIIPERISLGMGVWNNAMVSQSFAMALILMFITLSTLFMVLLVDKPGKLSVTCSRVLFLNVGLPILLFATGITKISVGAILLAVYFYLFGRMELYRYQILRISPILGFLATFAVWWLVRGENNSGVILVFSPFDFFRKYVAPDLRPFSFFAYFAWTLLYLISRIHEEKLVTLRDAWEAVRHTTKIIDVEIVVVIAIISSLPGILFSIPSGSANYFSEVQSWVALGFLLATTKRMAFPRNNISSRSDLIARLLNIHFRQLMIIIVSVSVIAALYLGFKQQFRSLVQQNVTIRKEIATNGKVLGIRNLLQLVFRKDVSAAEDNGLVFSAESILHSKRSQEYELVNDLMQLERFPIEKRRHSAVFVPRSNEAFWGGALAVDQSYGAIEPACANIPFIVPAMSGLALLGGMPSNDCHARFYGYPVYPSFHLDSRSHEVNMANLCEYAKRWAFDHIYILEQTAKGEIVTKEKVCT